MRDKNRNPDNEGFSEDPIENLRIENDLMKLKLQAQYDAITGGNAGEMSPEIEFEFLNHVLQFEEACQNVSYKKVFDILGKPVFETLETLRPDEIEGELTRLQKLMAEKDIYLNVIDNYEPSIMYRFITEEFFQHEMEDLSIPGLQNNFIYEEFHPNPKIEIRDNTLSFLKNWFNKTFDDHSLEFNHEMITADGKQYTSDEVTNKLNHELSVYKSLSDEKYEIINISFQWKLEPSRGMGYSEGTVSYDAEIEGGRWIQVNGPFKFYFCNDNGYWNIFYFVFPGFEW